MTDRPAPGRMAPPARPALRQTLTLAPGGDAGELTIQVVVLDESAPDPRVPELAEAGWESWTWRGFAVHIRLA